MCNTLRWSLSAGYTTKCLRLDTPRNTKQAEISYDFDGPGITQCMRKCWENVIVTHVLWVILDVEFDGNINCYVWLNSRSGSGQKRLYLQTQNFHSEACLSCSVLPQDSKKWHLFWCTIRNTKKPHFKNIKNLPGPHPETPALRSNSFSLRDVLVIQKRVISKPMTYLL